VIVTVGSAMVMAGGKRVELQPGLMTNTGPGGGSLVAQTAEQDLIRNGDFKEPPTSGAELVENGGMGTAAWLPIREQAVGDRPAGGTVSVQAEKIAGQEVRAAVVNRSARGDERYARVGFSQEINAPASFLQVIELNATLKVVAQTEPAGGPQGDAFPLTVRITYTDPNGREQAWSRSFYYCSSGPGTCSMENAIDVPLGRWESPRDRYPASFVIKGTTDGPDGVDISIGQDIAVINTIEIYGIGTTFESWITDVSLLAR
jgi:hypothetical protein